MFTFVLAGSFSRGLRTPEYYKGMVMKVGKIPKEGVDNPWQCSESQVRRNTGVTLVVPMVTSLSRWKS